MHISEGVLSAPVLVAGAAVTFAGTTVGLKKLDYDHVMSVAILGSAFFIASLIHVPTIVGSAHLLLGGLMGLILGWSAFPAILAALVLQFVFFQYGGLLVLGVNCAIIAGPAVICGLFFRPHILENNKTQLFASFGAGFLSIGLSAALMALSLWLSNQNFLKAAIILLITNLPIMVIEGIVTLFVVRFLSRVQPDILSFSIPMKTLCYVRINDKTSQI